MVHAMCAGCQLQIKQPFDVMQVPTKVAVSIKQVPTKVALGVKALADGDDNKEALVSDIFPKPAAEA